ncbi:alpha/beta fold hydrolase [Pedosphaera parvula]|uniref:Alpha/beta hydrolase fold protein n=1 Tax=Pedosphaera parvula (strain Ellin514) TaxID=320771 RepID=B9XJH1_PEDPL|nr:alpha/beta fold hydrolase [Pedosphaera parvula]EEF60032.1 alpha/beta hydrolase fold protein [Pedosphaera parvula Ellin514]
MEDSSFPMLCGSPWAPFEQMDQWRRWHGRWLERCGGGPCESPSHVLLRKPVLTLRAYTQPEDAKLAVLIVPAPIKRSYIWDLAPDVSVIQQLIRSNLSVYLAQWEEPGVGEQDYGLAEYGHQLILACLQAIEGEIGSHPVFLVGHSLGGTLAAIFCALHPERVAGLVLLGAPLHFGPGVDCLSSMVANLPQAIALPRRAGNVPGSVLDVASLLAAPGAFLYSRWLDGLASLPEPQRRRTHLRVERWTDDELPLARRFFAEIVELLYREDRFLRGTLEIAGKWAKPTSVTMPLLNVAERQSAVAPPASMHPFYQAVGSRRKRWLWYEGDVGVCLQHVGMLVGRTAHRTLWPAIVRWIQEQE